MDCFVQVYLASSERTTSIKIVLKSIAPCLKSGVLNVVSPRITYSNDILKANDEVSSNIALLGPFSDNS